jgi:hypothetical protein
MYLQSLSVSWRSVTRSAGFLPDELPEVSGWEMAAYFQAARRAGISTIGSNLPDGKLILPMT